MEGKIRKIASYVKENRGLVIHGSPENNPKYIKVKDSSIDGKVPGAISIEIRGASFTIWNPSSELSQHLIPLVDEIYSHLPEEAKETERYNNIAFNSFAVSFNLSCWV